MRNVHGTWPGRGTLGKCKVCGTSRKAKKRTTSNRQQAQNDFTGRIG